MRSIIISCFFLLSTNASFGTINLSNESPKVGESIILTTDEDVSQLFFIYRPNSQVEILDSIPVENQTAEWIPSRAGVVNLRAGSSNRNVSVRYASLSWSGLFVMLLAFSILFGGAGFAFRLLFRSEEGTDQLDPTIMPDT